MSLLDQITKNDIINLNSIPLVSELECSIDNVIPFDPVICVSCQTIFCKKCIECWKSQGNNICPKRCTPLITSSIKGSILEQQFLSIRLKCKNFENGCMEHLTLDNKKQHELICEFNERQCQYCSEYVAINEEFVHLYNNCSKFKVECLYCKEMFGLCEIREHVAKCKEGFKVNGEEFRIGKCGECGRFDVGKWINEKKHKCEEEKEDMGSWYRLGEWSERRMNELLKEEEERVGIIGKDVRKKRDVLMKMKEGCLEMVEKDIVKKKGEIKKICGKVIKEMKEEIEKEQQEINEIKDAVENMEGYKEVIEDIRKEIEKEKSFELLEKINAYEEVKLKLKQKMISDNSIKNN